MCGTHASIRPGSPPATPASLLPTARPFSAAGGVSSVSSSSRSYPRATEEECKPVTVTFLPSCVLVFLPRVHLRSCLKSFVYIYIS